MPASIKRKQSKRMTCRKRYKIIKKVAEHRRKVRREQRKNPKHNKPKDPGVPNSVPFKEEILQEAEQRKQRAQALKESQKANRLKLRLQNRGIDEMINIATEMNKEQSLKKEDISPKEKEIDLGTASRDLKKLIEEADVVLEVLDQVQEIEMSFDQTEFDFQINKQEEESEFQKVQQMFVSKGVESIASCPTDCFSLNQEEQMGVGMEEDMAEVKEVVLKKKTKKCKRMKHKK